jgi:stearoyl-CoA desaturase (delta-9 desaturase)
VKFQHHLYFLWNIVFSLLIPAFFCHLLFNDAIVTYFFYSQYKGGTIYAGLVRSVFGMHVLLLPYSLGSLLGSRRFNISKYPLDSALISIFTCGEVIFDQFLLRFSQGYQNFHHEFPSDYRLGPGMLSWDPSKYLIKFLAFLGLASNLHKTSVS